LNRQFNHTLKAIFKGAATTVIGRGGDEPINRHYVRANNGGVRPGAAREQCVERRSIGEAARE
jgi:hypothetical protein